MTACKLTPKDIARKRQKERLDELEIRDRYRRDHSPTGVMRRRIRQNPDTGEYEILPEPIREEKPKRAPDDPRMGNLRHRKG